MDTLEILIWFIVFVAVGALTINSWYVWKSSGLRQAVDNKLVQWHIPLTISDLEQYALNAVRAAQQMWASGQIEKDGRKAVAVTALQGFLAGTELGEGGARALTGEALSALIESAVALFKDSQRQPFIAIGRTSSSKDISGTTSTEKAVAVAVAEGTLANGSGAIGNTNDANSEKRDY